MSDYETKSGIRVEIKSLKGKSRSEAYVYFQSILGDAEDVDEFDGEVEWFEYSGKFQPGQEYSYGETDDDRWFVDMVASEGKEIDGEGDLYLSFEKLNSMVDELIEKFGIEREDVMVFSYTWYNGADEPRHVEPPKSHA